MLKLGGVVGGVVGGNASAEGGLDRWRSGEVRLDGMAVSGDLGAASASVRLRLDNRQRMVELAICNVVRIVRTTARWVVMLGAAERCEGGRGGLRTVLRGISLQVVWERRTSVLIRTLVRATPRRAESLDTAGARAIRAGTVGGGARKQRSKERCMGRGTDNGVSTAEAIAETVQNLDNLRLDIGREDRYVIAVTV